MDHPDYTSLARDAEVKAGHARSSDIATGYRDLAKTYRALAEQVERMAHRYPQRWADHAAIEGRREN